MTGQYAFAYPRPEYSSSLTTKSTSSHTTKLLHRVRRAARTSTSRLSVSFADADPKENDANDNPIPSMATSKLARQKRRSLSAMSNNSFQGLGDDSIAESGSDIDSEAEELSWNIINREIQEWQYVCRTGRPFWWSPDSKAARLRTLPPVVPEVASTRIWSKMHRRATSESYLADSRYVDELAQMIAVQLLGACFTLPPEYLVVMESYPASYNRRGSSRFQDPRMISALRMHTHFRYSPCFGHQARSTSPIQIWAGGYDGSPYSASSPGTSGMRTPTIECSGPARLGGMLRKTSRARNVTETSTEQLARDNDDIDTSKVYRGLQVTPQRRLKYRLQPVLRSEPHHVYVQPVRELVVKRWRSLRRQFGGSLHSAAPADASEDVGSDRGSDATSPAMSSDARSRRRRAQERGEIYSSSMNSSPRYNTPTTCNMTPTASGHGTPPPSSLSSLSPHQEIELQEMESPSRIDRDTPTQALNHLFSERLIDTGAQHSLSMAMTRSEAGFFVIQSEPSPGPVFIPKGTPKRKRRTSMLSEMCAAGDITNEGTLVRDPVAARLGPLNANAVAGEEHLFPSQRSRFNQGSSQNELEQEQAQPESFEGRGRARIVRTSTNGTQIFSPDDDGIEVDGLPVGPGRDIWGGAVDDAGKRRERSYL